MVSFRWHVIMFYFRCLRYYQYFHHFLVPLFKKKNEPKVFCIGYVKTGLTSLAKALSILGYRSVQFLRTASEPKEGWVEFIINRNYDAFTDYPLWMKDVYSRLDKVIPNSKFILSIRDKQSWMNSYYNYYKGGPFEAKNSEELQQKYQRYEWLNKQAIDYFQDKPNQLLIINIFEGDGWNELCNFLNKPIPNKPFPHKNIGRYKKPTR